MTSSTSVQMRTNNAPRRMNVPKLPSEIRGYEVCDRRLKQAFFVIPVPSVLSTPIGEGKKAKQIGAGLSSVP
jgi:hypothetical protein